MDLVVWGLTCATNANRLATLHVIVQSQKGGAASLQTGNNSGSLTQAKVYAITPGEAEMKNEAVTGTLPLFTGNAVNLFDSRATYSFISAKYDRRFHINLEPMKVGVVVSTPVGRLVICRKIVIGCPIHIEGRTLMANLIVFNMEGFDIILGMDWLSNNHAIIDCYNKEIIYKLPANSEFKFVGTKVGATPQLISAIQVTQLLLEECQVYLACLKKLLQEEIPIMQ
jgi:hypothetical protein